MSERRRFAAALAIYITCSLGLLVFAVWFYLLALGVVITPHSVVTLTYGMLDA